MANTEIKNKYNFNLVKYRYLWLGFSAILLIPCIIAILYLTITQPNHSPLKLGIDFTGGTILQYSISADNNLSSAETVNRIRTSLDKINVKKAVIQSTTQASQDSKINNLISIRTTFLSDNNSQEKIDAITEAISKNFNEATLVQVNSVGPTLGSELLKNTLIALIIAFVAMVIYISFRFQTEYGWIALLTLFHDALFVVGIFAIKGIFFDTTVDSLFITAILTVIGYSINDTIVVFDRIRENMRFYSKKLSSNEIINNSINQTVARSINTSATTLFTLLALYFFGGSNIKEFVLAIILGVAVGTYSSIFVAGTILSIVKEKFSK